MTGNLSLPRCFCTSSAWRSSLPTHFDCNDIRADDDGVGRRFLDGFLDLRPERIAAAQLARIDPAVLPVIGERRAEIAHERVVLSSCGR